MLHVKLFFYLPVLLCHFILLRENYSTVIHSFGRGLILFIYIHINFFQSLLSSFMSLPFQISDECHSATHSFLKGLTSLYLVNSCFCYPSLIHAFGRGLTTFKPIYLFFFQEFLLSFFMSVPFHICRKVPFDHSFLSEGIDFSVFSLVSSVILQCSINPCFWEGVDVACQTFPLSSCIALIPYY